MIIYRQAQHAAQVGIYIRFAPLKGDKDLGHGGFAMRKGVGDKALGPERAYVDVCVCLYMYTYIKLEMWDENKAGIRQSQQLRYLIIFKITGHFLPRPSLSALYFLCSTSTCQPQSPSQRLPYAPARKLRRRSRRRPFRCKEVPDVLCMMRSRARVRDRLMILDHGGVHGAHMTSVHAEWIGGGEGLRGGAVAVGVAFAGGEEGCRAGLGGGEGAMGWRGRGGGAGVTEGGDGGVARGGEVEAAGERGVDADVVGGDDSDGRVEGERVGVVVRGAVRGEVGAVGGLRRELHEALVGKVVEAVIRELLGPGDEAGAGGSDDGGRGGDGALDGCDTG